MPLTKLKIEMYLHLSEERCYHANNTQALLSLLWLNSLKDFADVQSTRFVNKKQKTSFVIN
jgi:hypothetical protein